MKMKWRALIFCGVAVMAAGCAQLGYFAQAAHGQFSLLSEARPIDDWLASPGVEDKLKGKLTKVKEIRAFAARELGLPDNDSYTTRVRWWLSAVVCSRSMASIAMLTAVSKPNV